MAKAARRSVHIFRGTGPSGWGVVVVTSGNDFAICTALANESGFPGTQRPAAMIGCGGAAAGTQERPSAASMPAHRRRALRTIEILPRECLDRCLSRP